MQALASASRTVLGHCPPFSIYPAATYAPKFQFTAGIPTVPSFWARNDFACARAERMGQKSIMDAFRSDALVALDILDGSCLDENGKPLK